MLNLAFHIITHTHIEDVEQGTEELKRVLGPGREVVTGGWSALHNEFHSMHF